MSDQPPWDQSIERQIPGLREAVASLSSVASNSRFRVVTIVLSPHHERPGSIPPPTRIAITPEAEAPSEIVATTAGQVHAWTPAHPHESWHAPAESSMPSQAAQETTDDEQQVSRRSKRASTSLLRGESEDGNHSEKRKRLSEPQSSGQPIPSGAFWGTVLQDRSEVSQGIAPLQGELSRERPTFPGSHPQPLPQLAGQPISGLGQRSGTPQRSYTGLGVQQVESERLQRMSTLPALRLRSPIRQRNPQPVLPSLQDPPFGPTGPGFPDRRIRSPGRGEANRYSTHRSFRRTASQWLGRLSPFGAAGPSVSSGTVSPLAQPATPLSIGTSVATPSLQGNVHRAGPELMGQRTSGETAQSQLFPGVQTATQYGAAGQYGGNFTQYSGSASGSGVSQGQPTGASMSPPAESTEIQRVITSTRGRRGRRMGMSHEREQIFACDRCSSTFKRKSDKNRHVRVVHEKSRPFSCPLCPKTFGEKSNMLKHRASVHDDVRTFRCPYCDESFPQRGLCDAHVRNVHDRKQAKYFCEHCGLPFSRKVQLNEHYEQAHPEYLSTYGQYYSGSSSTAAAAIAGPSVGRDMVRDDRTLVGDTLTGVQTRGLDTGGLPAFGSIGPGEGRTNPPIPPALPYPLPQLAPQRETGEAEEAEVRRRSLQGDNSGL